MATPKHKRRVGKFSVITNAEDLVKYTIEITSNEKNFPKRYRWCLTSKIVESSISMFSDLTRANNIRVTTPEDYKLRRGYQVRALAEISNLLGLMQIAYDVFQVDADLSDQGRDPVSRISFLFDRYRESDQKNQTQKHISRTPPSPEVG